MGSYEFHDIEGKPVLKYDVVICGGGGAGLWILNILVKAGFSVLLIEKEALGGIQTVASQGMIHGGQRYMLTANYSIHAESVAPLPERWNACLRGEGELDLSGVRVLSERQVMWSTGGLLGHLAVNTATYILKARARKLETRDVPLALADSSVPSVYELPEKVLDIGSLVNVLSAPHGARIRKGSIESLGRDGRLVVSGISIEAQIVICAAGVGNEDLMALLGVGRGGAQQRPLRQLMVKTMSSFLYGHGINASYKPRVTVTSHPLPSGGYVWYLGGALADETLSLTEDDAVAFAKQEMKAMFSHLHWDDKQWATWYGVRAEASSPTGRLPNGPVVQEYGNVLVVWPTKLTLTPLLGDYVLQCLSERRVVPEHSGPPSEPPNLPKPAPAPVPWACARWK